MYTIKQELTQSSKTEQLNSWPTGMQVVSESPDKFSAYKQI